MTEEQQKLQKEMIDFAKLYWLKGEHLDLSPTILWKKYKKKNIKNEITRKIQI